MMEVELSDNSIRKVAREVAAILRQSHPAIDMTKEMVPTKEAARILGITPARLRQIKDRYPHIKNGEHSQGKLLFKREALLRIYAQ